MDPEMFQSGSQRRNERFFFSPFIPFSFSFSFINACICRLLSLAFVFGTVFNASPPSRLPAERLPQKVTLLLVVRIRLGRLFGPSSGEVIMVPRRNDKWRGRWESVEEERKRL